jgi:hypothetical protein
MTLKITWPADGQGGLKALININCVGGSQLLVAAADSK